MHTPSIPRPAGARTRGSRAREGAAVATEEVPGTAAPLTGDVRQGQQQSSVVVSGGISQREEREVFLILEKKQEPP
jgi:hypothetical protein